MEALGELLRHRELHVTPEGEAFDLAAADKKEAAEALAEGDDKSAVPLLGEGLSNPDPRVRASVLSALASTPPRDARLLLVETIATPRDVTDASGRSVALLGLARGDGDVVEELVNHLVVRDDDLLIGPQHEAAVEALLERGTTSRERVSELLIDALGQADERVRERAHRLLALLGGAALEPAIRALKPAESRKEAVKALGHIRNTAAVEPLLPLLENDSPQVRSATAWALGEIKDPRAVEPLAKAVRDAEYEVRTAAMSALNGFGSVAIIHLEALVGGSAAQQLQSNGQTELPSLAQTVTRRPDKGSRLTRVLRAALDRDTI